MIWVVIENSFVIVASSIPLLRPLFSSKYAKSKNSNTGASYPVHSASYELSSRGIGMSGQGAKARSRVKSLPLASDSEENIWNAHDSANRGGIMKEVRVQVNYDGDDLAGDTSTSRG